MYRYIEYIHIFRIALLDGLEGRFTENPERTCNSRILVKFLSGMTS